MMPNSEKTMEKVVGLCKNRGFVYSGFRTCFYVEYLGHYSLGEFKIMGKNAWHKKFVQENPYNVALDSAILMNPQVWVASAM